MNEIEIPKQLRQFMLEGAEETKLGNKMGAKKTVSLWEPAHPRV